MDSAVSVRQALAQSGLVAVDAQVLLAHVLRCNRAWLGAHGDDPLAPAAALAFETLARRRREGEPVAYLTGVREFWGLPLRVSAAVLIPRPETETLVEVALARLPSERATRVLDLGTGSGAIALALARERRHARVLALDISPAALRIARGNAASNGLANVEFAASDWYADVPTAWQAAPFDLIASNPPYVAAGDAHLAEGDLRHEPAIALSAGDDGLVALRAVVAGARARLVPGGTLVVEHGYDQIERVRALFAGAGFIDIVSTPDLAGIPRVLAGVSPDANAW